MAWESVRSFPRAIMHVDGDSFFASCEVAKDPSLRGRAVITGLERGIVSSMTYEARRLGIRRAMPLHEIARKWPEVVILPSDYETYSLISSRMYSIVRRYTPVVEEYSIDECFADLTGMRRTLRMPYPAMVVKIKGDLERELGMTFSMGLSATKVLAKIGSKWEKPAGLTVIPLNKTRSFLENTLVGSVWGIGPNTAAYLQKFGIRTAFDFAARDEAWVRAKLSKPGIELWQELGGTVVNEIDGAGRETYQSISKTKTFTPSSRERAFVFSELSKNIENACIKARRWGLATKKIIFFLKTQDFAYHTVELTLSHETCVPQDMLRHVTEHFPRAFREGAEYRATGVTLLDLADADTVQLDLFGAVIRSQALVEVFKSVDALCERYGKHSVFLASSLQTLSREVGEGERGGRSTTTSAHFRGESARRRLGLAFLGEVA